MKEFAVIVAGGTGQRMNSSLPKQFLLLDSEPVLFHTLKAFWAYSKELSIILVLPEDQIDSWKALVDKYAFEIPHSITKGGTTRTLSVQNGLSMIPDGALVAIHDGVRPMVATEIIRNSFQVARTSGSAIAAVSPKDSVRAVEDNGGSSSMDRSQIRLVQTPQTFQSTLIKAAYDSIPDGNFTDDASVFEANGNNITLIEGSYKNIKMTTPEDISIAQALIKSIS